MKLWKKHTLKRFCSAMKTGCPVFEGATAQIDCELDRMVPAGDHTIAVGRVVDVWASAEHEPLIYYRRAYRAAV